MGGEHIAMRLLALTLVEAAFLSLPL